MDTQFVFSSFGMNGTPFYCPTYPTRLPHARQNYELSIGPQKLTATQSSMAGLTNFQIQQHTSRKLNFLCRHHYAAANEKKNKTAPQNTPTSSVIPNYFNYYVISFYLNYKVRQQVRGLVGK